MKKVGQFFFTFIPVILALTLQFAAAFFALGIGGMIQSLRNAGSADASAGLLNNMMDLFSAREFSTAIMLIYALLVVMVFGLWYYIKYNGEYRVAPKKLFHPLSLFGILLLIPGGQFVTSYIVSFTSLLFPKWLENYERLIEDAGLTGSISILMIFYGVFIGPVAEELIFRGVTMRQAEKCLPFWAANIFQALLFGAYHMNMMQGVYAFFVGLLLGFICRRAKIHNSILFHILFNAWGLLLPGLLNFTMTNTVAVIILVSTIVFFTCGMLCFYFGTKKMQNTAEVYE